MAVSMGKGLLVQFLVSVFSSGEKKRLDYLPFKEVRAANLEVAIFGERVCCHRSYGVEPAVQGSPQLYWS